MTEADWQKQVIELARLFKWRVAHFRPAMTKHGWVTPVAADGKGWPDLFLVRERVIAAELKSDKGKLSPDQEAWRDALATAGIPVYVWRPSDFDTVAHTLRRRVQEAVEFEPSIQRANAGHTPTRMDG